MSSDDTSQTVEHLQRYLLENALDSLLSAAEAVCRDDGPRRLKDAVLHAANGVELLLKSRLASEHWSLIFSGIDHASKGELAKGEFKSVDFLNALARLEKIVEISIDALDKLHLDNLRKLRNRITHFNATLDAAQTKSLVAKSMNFCVAFCEQEEMITGDEEDKFGEIHKTLTDLQEFVQMRMASVMEAWEGILIWECPECWQEALVIDAGQAECKFCRHRADPQELAIQNSEGTIEDCPECDAESTFVLVLYNNESAEWVCFSCGERGEEYRHCNRCDRMMSILDREGPSVCSSCWSYVMERG